MTILIEVQTCEIELVVALDFFWKTGLGRGGGNFLSCGRGSRVAKQYLSVSGFDDGAECSLFDSLGQLGDLQKSTSRLQIALPLCNGSGRGLQANFGGWKCLRRADANVRLTRMCPKTEGHILVGLVCGANLPNGVHELTEGLRFSGSEK